MNKSSEYVMCMKMRQTERNTKEMEKVLKKRIEREIGGSILCES